MKKYLILISLSFLFILSAGATHNTFEYDFFVWKKFEVEGSDQYYKFQSDEWRRKKLNEWYTHNKDLDYMTVHDRALWLLAKYHIDVNPHVYKAILCADGLFDPAAETYFKSYVDTRHVLGSIVHFGDWLSTICEKQTWLQGEEEHSD